MSTNKMIVQGFGTGSVYGVPTTIALDSTKTLSITSALVGMYQITGMATGVNLSLVSTTNGVTDTIKILDGGQGLVFLDGVSGFLVNTTTSVTIKAIGL
jgi:hypothetical protein